MIKYLRNLFRPEPELSAAERMQLLDHAMQHEHELEQLKKEFQTMFETKQRLNQKLMDQDVRYKNLEQCNKVNLDQFENYRKTHEHCSVNEPVIMRYKDIEHVKRKGGRPKKIRP